MNESSVFLFSGSKESETGLFIICSLPKKQWVQLECVEL